MGPVITVYCFDVAVETIVWAPTSSLFHIIMSLKVRQLMKKLSGVFKDESTTPSTPDVASVGCPPAQLPRLPFKPIFGVLKDLPLSVKIDNLECQLSCIDHLVDLIDMIYKDNFPIGRGDIRCEQPGESVADRLAMQLWTHFESSR